MDGRKSLKFILALKGKFKMNEATGLMYFRARYFDNDQGRFINRDSLGYVDGMGLYNGYFAPRGMDPSGNWKITMEFEGDSRGPYMGAVCAEQNDTLADLAAKITGDSSNASLLSQGASAVPGSTVYIHALLKKLEELLRDKVVSLIHTSEDPGSLNALFPIGNEDAIRRDEPITTETLKNFFNNTGEGSTVGVCDCNGAVRLIYLQAVNSVMNGLYGSYDGIPWHEIGGEQNDAIKGDWGYFKNHEAYGVTRKKRNSGNYAGVNVITISQDNFYSFNTGVQSSDDILNDLVTNYNLLEEGNDASRKAYVAEINKSEIANKSWQSNAHRFYKVHQVGKDGLNRN